VIFSVFCPAADGEVSWQSELLGYSWGHARQPGELVHLHSKGPLAAAPCHPLARVLETQSWSPHPYTGDVYPPYQRAAALLEWLFVERIEGTVLVLGPTSVFRVPVTDQVRPGQARAVAWTELPRGDGPFGLASRFDFLAEFCVDRTLEVPAVKLPALIHATDLRKIVVRWLELMSIIRAETAADAQSPFADADKIAYVIAAAEARVPHTTADLGLLDYRHPIPAMDGAIAWDPVSYRSWDPVQPESAQPGPGRELLSVLAELVERRAHGTELSLLRPCRQDGVRQGKILGSVFLEIPGRPDTVSLNSSGAAIWAVCDGTRSLAEINHELETRFEMPSGSLRADVEVVIKRLERIGALRLASA
jgi:hypothetical protein